MKNHRTVFLPYKVIVKNLPRQQWQDHYYSLLGWKWSHLISLVIGIFLLVNTVFAFLYWLSPGCVANAKGFWDLWFFSQQTFSTTGYGAMVPVTFYSHLLSTLETILNFLFMALVTGIIFAKFSLPKARILFTRKILITQFEGRPAVVFRLANARVNQISDVTIHLNLLLDEKTQEGILYRRFHPLTLRASFTPIFALSWTGVHFIETEGNLSHLSQDFLQERKGEFFCTVLGTDSMTGQPVNALHVFKGEQIVWGGRFADILTTDEEGSRILDFQNFHQVITP